MSQKNPQPSNPQAPVQEFRAGGVRAAIWRRETEKDGRSVVEHNTKITRSYRDKQGNWQEVNTYYPDDLAKLILVTQEAYRYVTLRDSSAESDDLPV
jgi:hypothetical protein